MNRREILRATLAAPFVATLPRHAHAATWPEREISVILPVAPGSVGDLAPRTLMAAVAPRLGVPVVIKNMPGGGGALAYREALTAKPDGYTVTTTGTTSHNLLRRTADMGFDIVDATSMVCQCYAFNFAIAVRPDSPIKTIDDLVAEGKKRQVNYSAVNVISTVLSMFTLAKLTGANFNWVKTVTNPEAVTQAVGGHVDAVIGSASDLLTQQQAGTLRLIASAGTTRIPALPDLKTIKEQGYDAYSVSIVGLGYPKGVPEDIRARLETAVGEASKDPAVVTQFEKMGVSLAYATGAEFDRFIAEIDKQIYPILVQAGMAK